MRRCRELESTKGATPAVPPEAVLSSNSPATASDFFLDPGSDQNDTLHPAVRIAFSHSNFSKTKGVSVPTYNRPSGNSAR